MDRQLVIDGIRIADDSDCYVIAEIGHNHQGNVDICKQMFHAAKEAGAHAVKLQKRDNRTLFTKEMYDKPYENRNSYGNTYGEHREALEFGKDEYAELKAYAKEIGVTFFSTAFDIPSADFLAEFDMPAYKIASADLKNVPLLKHVASIGKPMIISTGGATIEDVDRACNAIMPINSQLCILQCTAGYPPAWEEIDLRVIETYRNRYPSAVIGLSSHDSGIALAVAAYALGSRVVEKHFTLNRASKGTDHAFSLEPVGLRKLVRDLQRTRVAMGTAEKVIYPSEIAPITKMAKSIVAKHDLPAGHLITADDIAFKCPGGGMAPYEVDQIIGQITTTAMKADDKFTPECVTSGRKMAA